MKALESIVLSVLSLLWSSFIVWLLWTPMMVATFGLPEIGYWKIVALLLMLAISVTPALYNMAVAIGEIKKKLDA